MNRDMIDFLHKVLDMRSYVPMTDCKMSVEELIDGLNVKGTRFVTKVPANFNGRLRDTVVSSVLSGRMDESPTRRGRVRYETRDTIRGRSLRVIAYIIPRNKEWWSGHVCSGCFRGIRPRLRPSSFLRPPRPGLLGLESSVGSVMMDEPCDDRNDYEKYNNDNYHLTKTANRCRFCHFCYFCRFCRFHQFCLQSYLFIY